VTVQLTVEGVGESERTVTLLDGDTELAAVKVRAGAPQVVSVTRPVPAGVSSLRMTVSGPTDKTPGDDRVTVARVTDLEVSAAGDVRAVSMLDQARTGWVVP
jgi:hypothetical protein